ncbi:MAG: 5-oxoprolinase subunit PxpA [Dokdonella sp.]
MSSAPKSIDLNCDLGESFGAWKMGDDEGALKHISSANIACGFHAGDPATMRRTVAAAIRHDVAIGAHPSLPDLQGFGRREIAISASEVHDLILYQIGALAAFAKAEGGTLSHVKPHGALYNMAARDVSLADAVADAVRDFDSNLILVGLSGSELPAAGERAGLRVAHEVFSDRRYRADGSLLPRSDAGAVIDDIAEAIDQALRLATRGEVVTDDGSVLAVRADTLCLHGDRPTAAEFASRLRVALDTASINVVALRGSR